jgi:hypothetical protein
MVPCRTCHSVILIQWVSLLATRYHGRRQETAREHLLKLGGLRVRIPVRYGTHSCVDGTSIWRRNLALNKRHGVPEAMHALSTSSPRECQWGGTYDRRFVAESNPSVINDALSGDVNGLRMLLSAASVPRAPRNQEILSSQPPACSREAAENEKSYWYGSRRHVADHVRMIPRVWR